MSSFLDILSKYENFDNRIGTDKNTVHSYGPLYTDIFAGIAPTQILEIGIYSGAFLRVLSNYFQDAKVIIGLDITLENVVFTNIPRVKTLQRDGTCKSTADEMIASYGLFDLIIEDGSHLIEHQLLTLRHFASCLSTTGVFVMEDIDIGKYPDIQSRLQCVADSVNLAMEWHDMRATNNRFDDVVAVFRHKSVQVGACTMLL